MPEVFDLVDAADATDAPPAPPLPPLPPLPLPQPALPAPFGLPADVPLPAPSGAPADVPPPGLAVVAPSPPTIGRPSLPTAGKPGAAQDDDDPGASPTDPLLAAAASGDPHAMAAAAHFAAMKHAASMPTVKNARGKKHKSNRRPIVVPILLLGLLGGAAYVGRDSTYMTRLRGEGYDSSMLPMVVYERPSPAGVERTEIEYRVRSENGVPSTDEIFRKVVTNPATGDSQVKIRVTQRSVADGEPVEPAISAEDLEVILVGGSSYSEPQTEGGQWEQRPRWWANTGAQTGDVWMYQDLIDQSLRRVTPESVEAGTFGAVPVTIYAWEIPFEEIYESAPFVFKRFDVLDGNAEPDSTVSLTISVDEQGVVRVVDIQLELASVIEHATAQADGSRYPYGYRVELDSLDDSAPTITVPTNFLPYVPAPEAEGGA